MTPLHIDLALPITRLVLIGGGEFSFGDTREIDEQLIAQLPRDNKRIAFLPTASGSAEYATHLGKYFKEIDAEVETINVPVYRPRDGRRRKNLDLIRFAGLIYLGGGVTNNLLAAVRESGAEMAMRDAAADGVTIAAIGAAASCFGTNARDMQHGGSAVPAFGWLDATVIDTGFDPSDDTMLRRLMSIPGTRLGIGISPKTALTIGSDGNARIIGDGNIAAFRKS
ncbi:MAG TPA: Type 1 glutamine amidotransferase-like domain-containing protein [Thermoanaerobaculia bacterium]|nr:Type 1 glutamine amidotransferase-like domain-containing protein [Thermoanaerobaculia bacterium]